MSLKCNEIERNGCKDTYCPKNNSEYETFPLVSSKVLLDTLKSFELNLLESIYMYHE